MSLLSNLKSFLKSNNVSLKKSLAQNFLIDRNMASKVVREANIREKDLVLEIGPGLGALTEECIKLGAEVIAVEIDALFAEALKNLPITIYNDDILSFPLEKLTRQCSVISNLPYHLTAAILSRLLPRRDLFSSFTFIMQEEMARRVTANPGSKEYGSLTIFVQFYSSARYLFRVPGSCFYPSPNVDSAVVNFHLHEPEANLDEEGFFSFVRCSFGQRRKMLKNNLEMFYEKALILKAFSGANIELRARAEELSLSSFINLYRQITR